MLGADSLIVPAGKLWFMKSDEILQLRGLSQRQTALRCSLAEFEWGKKVFFPPRGQAAGRAVQSPSLKPSKAGLGEALRIAEGDSLVAGR